MWLKEQTVLEIEKIARFRYISKLDCALWNAHRREGELRLLTGWEWIARDGSGRHQQGFKTRTVAYRDAWYVLVKKEASAPGIALGRGTLHVVGKRVA